jgi:hypothetical protein
MVMFGLSDTSDTPIQPMGYAMLRGCGLGGYSIIGGRHVVVVFGGGLVASTQSQFHML